MIPAFRRFLWMLSRRRDIDRRLARLRDTVYDAPSLNDDPSYREQFQAALFRGLCSPAHPTSVKVTHKKTVVADLPLTSPSGEHGTKAARREPSPGQPVEAVWQPPGGTGNPEKASPPRPWYRNTKLGIVSFAGIAIVTAGFLLLENTFDDGPTQAQQPPGFPIRVGYLPVVDAAPFYRAIDRGYFTEVGLAVSKTETASGPKAISSLMQGSIDVAFSSDPAFFNAEIGQPGAVKIINTAYTAKGLHLALVSRQGGSFVRLNQSAGKKIAVTSTNSISDLGLVAQGVSHDSVTWIPMPFSDMARALSVGEVDGAVVAEPFVTILTHKYNTHLVTGISQGDTDSLPMSSWGVTADFVRRHPKEVAAFQQALVRGAKDVQDPGTRDAVMSGHTPDLPVSLAAGMARGIYPTSIDAAELQRVADLMADWKVIPRRLNTELLLKLQPDGQS
jgi:NitT/TauT family transport system substrate-binding protein